VLFFEHFKVGEYFLKIFKILGLIRAEIVGVPPEMEYLTAFCGVRHALFDTTNSEWLEEGECFHVWSEKTARRDIERIARLYRGEWVCVVTAYVYVVIKEAECTHKTRLRTVLSATIEKVVFVPTVCTNVLFVAYMECFIACLIARKYN
jgi:hypothetical protein